jgi:TonB family protein
VYQSASKVKVCPRNEGEILAGNSFDCGELKTLLKRWLVPGVSATLDHRIGRSFYSHRKSPIGIASPRFPPATKEVSMKRCKACGEEFEDKFSFCPVDATPLNSLALANEQAQTHCPLAGEERMPLQMSTTAKRREFHLTMIDNTSLAERLSRELRFLFQQLAQAWPVLKRDPVGFAKDTTVAIGLRLQRALSSPNSAAAIATAMLLMLSLAMILGLSDRLSKNKDVAQPTNPDGEQQAQIVAFLTDPNTVPVGWGVGAGSNGRVGFRSGKGEGSAPQPKESTGGGGGGDHHEPPAPVGKLPQISEIPAPIPMLPPAHQQTLPAAGIDIDPALWKNLPMAGYGDPRSNSSTPSNGSGDGGGMGTGNGQGVGGGNGGGVGPGNDGNIGGGEKGLGCCGTGGSHGNNPEDHNRVFPMAQVTERARVLAKPEPQYTEDARRNSVMGTVVLRVVFSRNGEVTNIRAIQALPFGLTEKAIAAARLIRFRPATKDGHPVNVYMQLEYNFNLY